MDARTMSGNLNYIGMEKDARKLALEKKMAKPEEIALMTVEEICSLILKEYDVICCGSEVMWLVEKDKFDEFKKITAKLSR